MTFMFLLIADIKLLHLHCTRFKLSQSLTTQGPRVFSHFSSGIVGRAKLQGGKERNTCVRVKITPREKGETRLDSIALLSIRENEGLHRSVVIYEFLANHVQFHLLPSLGKLPRQVQFFRLGDLVLSRG